MTVASEWVEEARRHILGGYREELNRLDGAITNSQTSLTLKYDPVEVAAGTVLSIDLERIRVWERSGKSLTVVERGVDGTTQASHSDLAVIRVGSRFDDFAVLDAINDDLDDLSAPNNGLFKVATVDLTSSSSRRGYDLTGVSNMIGEPLDVRWSLSGSTHHWPELRLWRYKSNLPTSDFPSGRALFLDQGVESGRTIRVFYRQPFTRLAALNTDVSTSGLPSTAYDLPPLGAAMRLVAFGEARRSFLDAQGDSRRAEEVPPGSITASSRGLAAVRQQRIEAERSRLYVEYPQRVRT